MAKRAQITLFIIIGIVLVFSYALVIYSKEQIDLWSEDVLELPSDIQQIHSFVVGCAQLKAEEGIELIISKGGYYTASYMAYDENGENIPYYYHKGDDLVPENEIVERELCKVIVESLPSCIDGFNEFPGYLIIGDIESCESKLLDEQISVSLKYPLDINQEGSSFSMRRFNTKTDSNLKKMLDVTREYVDLQEAQPEEFAISNLTELANNNGLMREIDIDEDSATVVIKLKDSSSAKESVLVFAAGFSSWPSS